MSRMNKRIERITKAADRIVYDTDHSIRNLKARIRGLLALLAEEEKKIELDFEEVKGLEPYYYGDPDTLFVGSRKFRIESPEESLSVEKSRDNLTFWIKNHGESTWFTLRETEARKLARWILK